MQHKSTFSIKSYFCLTEANFCLTKENSVLTQIASAKKSMDVTNGASYMYLCMYVYLYVCMLVCMHVYVCLFDWPKNAYVADVMSLWSFLSMYSTALAEVSIQHPRLRNCGLACILYTSFALTPPWPSSSQSLERQ